MADDDTCGLDETARKKVQVLDVRERNGRIFHITDGFIEAKTAVKGSIDWEERFMKMQQHTGDHIVSGLIHAAYGYNNVGFHLGSETVRWTLTVRSQKRNFAGSRRRQIKLCGKT